MILLSRNFFCRQYIFFPYPFILCPEIETETNERRWVGKAIFDYLNGNFEIVEQDTNQSIATLVAAAKVKVMRTVLEDKWTQVPELSAERRLVLDRPF